MKTHPFGLIILEILLCLSSVASGQVSPAGRFVIQFPDQGDIFVSLDKDFTSAVYIFDELAGRVEVASIKLNSDWSGVALSSQGRLVSLSVGENAVVSIGSATVSVPRVPLHGPHRQTAYTGVLEDPTGEAVCVLEILPDGRCVVIYFNSVIVGGGIGTFINGFCRLTTVTGYTAAFEIDPTQNLQRGTAAVVGSFSVEYLLIEAIRSGLVNISTRGTVGAGQRLVAGFVIEGGTKAVLIRAVGPTLGQLGVPKVQSNPRLQLFKGAEEIAANDDWDDDDATLVAVMNKVGAFALAANSRDATLYVTLEPGHYTAQVTGSGQAGDALVEVYEVR